MPLYSPAHHQIRDSSIGTGSDNADAERVIPGFPTARTQTIEFAPYPRLRHRISRDKSRTRVPTSDLSTRNHTTNVSGTEYDIRTLKIALFCGF
jgi:hypothetical protein